LVIVDWLTKQAIFILAHDTITFADLACLFVLYVFSKHSVSSYVIFDRGLGFVLNFFHSLDTTLDMWLHFTSYYHLKEMDKLNTQTRYSSNISIYIIITSKTTGLNFCHLWSSLTIMLLVLLLMSPYSLIWDII